MDFILQVAQSSYYDYTPSTTSGDSAATAGAIILVMLFALIISAIAYAITSFLLGRIFKKAGIEAWKAWVPVYNTWLTLELGGQKGYWAVLAFIPFVNLVSAIFIIIAMYHIGVKFGKDGAFVLLAIFLPLVWYIWLAFDESTWKGPRVEAAPTNAPTDTLKQPTSSSTK
jgi:hypothetical protein